MSRFSILFQVHKKQVKQVRDVYEWRCSTRDWSSRRGSSRWPPYNTQRWHHLVHRKKNPFPSTVYSIEILQHCRIVWNQSSLNFMLFEVINFRKIKIIKRWSDNLGWWPRITSLATPRRFCLIFIVPSTLLCLGYEICLRPHHHHCWKHLLK